MRRDQGGFLVIEWMLAIIVLILPTIGLLALVSWPERINAVTTAAEEGAYQTITAGDRSDAMAQGRARALQVLDNHGYGEDAASVDVTGGLRPGDEITFSVTIRMPVLNIPGVGSINGFDFTRSHSERVPDFRS